MKIEDVESKQQQLIELLKGMAFDIKGNAELEKSFEKLKDIYSDGFRHRYADFFPLVVEINKEGRDFDSLTTNLVALQELSQNKLDKLEQGEEDIADVSNAIFKICDHINLEIGRYQQYMSAGKDIERTVENVNSLKDIVYAAVNDLNKANDKLNATNKKSTELSGELDDAKDKMDKANKKLKHAKDKLSSVQTELISVLSIFAAIVLTFSGSISFISSALSSIDKAPFYKTVFFVLLCGFVVFNTIFLMMYLVGKITGRSIYATCKHDDCAACTKADGKLKCSSIKRLRKRLPYIFWLNVVFLLLMIADIVLWIYFPWLECTVFRR